MNKLTVLLLILTFACVFVSGAIWFNTNSFAQNRALVNMKQEALNNPFYGLNEKAKAVKSGNQTSINEVADQIINQFGLLDVSSSVKEIVKERLVRAEMDFQKGEREGIPEENVVLMINELFERLSAPEYAKTNLRQVRHIRVSRMVYLPNLINQQDPDKIGGLQREIGSSINLKMSPLEAFYVAMDLIYQKKNNDYYQVTPQEFSNNLNQSRLEMRRSHQAEKARGSIQGTVNSSGETVYGLKASESSPKKDEMRQTLSRTLTMKRADILDLINTCSDTLGIER